MLASKDNESFDDNFIQTSTILVILYQELRQPGCKLEYRRKDLGWRWDGQHGISGAELVWVSLRGREQQG